MPRLAAVKLGPLLLGYGKGHLGQSRISQCHYFLPPRKTYRHTSDRTNLCRSHVMVEPSGRGVPGGLWKKLPRPSVIKHPRVVVARVRKHVSQYLDDRKNKSEWSCEACPEEYPVEGRSRGAESNKLPSCSDGRAARPATLDCHEQRRAARAAWRNVPSGRLALLSWAATAPATRHLYGETRLSCPPCVKYFSSVQVS